MARGGRTNLYILQHMQVTRTLPAGPCITRREAVELVTTGVVMRRKPNLLACVSIKMRIIECQTDGLDAYVRPVRPRKPSAITNCKSFDLTE